MKIGTYIVVGDYSSLVVLGYVGNGKSIQEGAFYLPAPWIVYLSCTSLVISIWNWKERFFVPLTV